jgi:hypothetical protein
MFISSRKSSRELDGDCMSLREGDADDRIQPHWTSAFDGYGLSSLETDVLEMGALVDHIRSEDGTFTS